ncbi:MAG: hypothetical protein R3C11_24350 [Planctomycetaceae bacterium]
MLSGAAFFALYQSYRDIQTAETQSQALFRFGTGIVGAGASGLALSLLRNQIRINRLLNGGSSWGRWNPWSTRAPVVSVGKYKGFTKAFQETASENGVSGVNFQGHHLNQDSAFTNINVNGKSVTIPRDEGLVVGVVGHSMQASQHGLVHGVLEVRLWDMYRPGGTRAGRFPTVGEYNEVLKDALRGAFDPEDAASLYEIAIKEQLDYGIDASARFTTIPARAASRNPAIPS